jgi:hypothetical protein
MENENENELDIKKIDYILCMPIRMIASKQAIQANNNDGIYIYSIGKTGKNQA